MRNLKKPVVAFIVLLCVAILVLLKTHLGVTGLGKNETGQEVNIENQDHDETESHANGAEEDEHEGGQDIEHDHIENDENSIQFGSDYMKEHGIEIATAGPGRLQVHADFLGEVVMNPERISHIVPYVPGIVREVPKKLGDKVKALEVMTVLDSRELSEIQSSFLVARERMALAETTYEREEKLWKQNISSEKEYLDAKQAFAEAGIELEAAEQKLHSLGFDEQYLEGLAFNDECLLTYYEIVAPIDGVVIEKNITIGEAVSEDADVFMIADLSTVWVNLTVYQKDLDYVHIGQPVSIAATEQNLVASGDISYISPIIDKGTRTVTARIELNNPDFVWRPGMFVLGNVAFDYVEVQVLIPKSALLMIDDKTVVFVQNEDGFMPQPVTVGKTNETHIEVLSGISAGQQYVIEGGFELKADIVTAGLGSHAGHGH